MAQAPHTVHDMIDSATLRFLEPSAHEVRVAALRYSARVLARLGYSGAALALELEVDALPANAPRVVPPELNGFLYQDDEAFDELDVHDSHFDYSLVQMGDL